MDNYKSVRNMVENMIKQNKLDQKSLTLLMKFIQCYIDKFDMIEKHNGQVKELKNKIISMDRTTEVFRSSKLYESSDDDNYFHEEDGSL